MVEGVGVGLLLGLLEVDRERLALAVKDAVKDGLRVGRDECDTLALRHRPG